MAELYHRTDIPQYFTWDRKYYASVEEQLKTLEFSRTIYVGNLSFYTTEMQIHATFSQAGPINRIIMGLNLLTKEPCGFCFVEYFTREAAAAAVNYISNTTCDERTIRCDLDGGYLPGRQYGRGKSGGQRRDDWRTEYDPGRGGVVREQLLKLGRKKLHGRSNRNYHKRGYHQSSDDNMEIDPNLINQSLSVPR